MAVDDGDDRPTPTDPGTPYAIHETLLELGQKISRLTERVGRVEDLLCSPRDARGGRRLGAPLVAAIVLFVAVVLVMLLYIACRV